MFIRKLKECEEFIAGDNTILRELFNPLKDDIDLRYSLAHAIVKPGDTTYRHSLKTSEVYYIMQGIGKMQIDNECETIKAGETLYIPPLAVQSITNIGTENLVFLAIVDPAWKPEDEEVFE